MGILKERVDVWVSSVSAPVLVYLKLHAHEQGLPCSGVTVEYEVGCEAIVL